jgi:hypothetical protein
LQYNGGLQVALANGLIDAAEASKRTIVFAMGANAMVIEDEDLTDLSGLGLPSIRQTNTDDLVVLPAKSVIGQADPNNPSLINGITKPLADQWVLTDTEINSVRTATAAYNGTINQLAAAKDIPVADMAATMAQMINGLKIEDGSVYTADYFNGANLDNLSFGLDGVHPNSRGYAIIANKFIDVINSKYNATLPKVVPAGYPTITILGSN